MSTGKRELHDDYDHRAADEFGPWATSFDTGPGVQLGTFWKRRMAMLATTSRVLPQLSRRVTAALTLIAVAAVAVPTVYLSSTPRALAEAPVSQTELPAAKVPVLETTYAQAPLKAQADAAPVKALSETTLTPPPRAAAPQAAAPAVEFIPPLSASEKAITAALDEPTDFEFAETPLHDVMDYLKAKHEIEIQFDAKALEDAGVDVSTPVTLSMKKVSLRSALRRMLRELDLTSIVADDVLLITSKEVASERTVTRTYPVADFFANMPGDEGERFVKMITSTVQPASWEASGGQGNLAFVPRSKSLVITQSYPVHEEILHLLRALREARSLENKSSATGGPAPTAVPIATAPAQVGPVQDAPEVIHGDLVIKLLPKLTGPKTLHVGNKGEFTIELTNHDSKPVRDVRILARFAPALEPQHATKGYEWQDAASQNSGLKWTINELPAGQTARYEVRCQAMSVDDKAFAEVGVKCAGSLDVATRADVAIALAEKTPAVIR